MPRTSQHSSITRTYLTHMVMCDLIVPPESLDFATMVDKLAGDIQTLKAIRETRYLRPRDHVAKTGNLHLTWVYAENPNDHDRFTNMLRVSPYVFGVLLDLIKDHEGKARMRAVAWMWAEGRVPLYVALYVKSINSSRRAYATCDVTSVPPYSVNVSKKQKGQWGSLWKERLFVTLRDVTSSYVAEHCRVDGQKAV
ncbi:hypothetical protein K438DRAFT_1934812 [Mycena galopus ATCC 62051]|nr:hypothetical protein K438DRAFT_1934812 [Mycena galopus ATCC 62051]